MSNEIDYESLTADEMSAMATAIGLVINRIMGGE